MTRHHLFAALFLLAAVTAYSQEAPRTDGQLQTLTNPGPRSVLTVAGVLALHDAKVDDSILLAKLNQAGTPMNLSTDEILQLKQAGVSDAVVRAMIAPNVGAPIVHPYRDVSFEKFHSMNPTGATLEYGADGEAFNNPLMPHDSGIYLDRLTDGADKLEFLDRAGITGVKMNAGAVFSFFAYPLTVRYQVGGPKSQVRTTEAKPTFYFYFEDKSAGLGKSWVANQGVSTPNQFLLEKFDANKKERLLTAGKFGLFEGTSNGQKGILFTTTRVRPGLYKVTVNEPLKPGEYAFVAPPATGTELANANDSSGAKPDLFDFAVDPTHP